MANKTKLRKNSSKNILTDHEDARDSIMYSRSILRMLEDLTGERELGLSKDGSFGLWVTLHMVNEALADVNAKLDAAAEAKMG